VRSPATLAALLLPLCAACGHAPAGPAPAGSAAGAPELAATFGRAAFAPAGDAGSTELPVPRTADPAALDELLAAAPKPAPRSGTGADGGSAVGSDTGVAEDAGADPGTATPPRTAKMRIGKVTEEAGMSAPAMERAGRAQLYWGLTQRCRDRDGGILPPEAVHLTFKLDADGYLLAPTILAEPKEERFAEAARCMQRALSTMTFRAPVSARGKPQIVFTDVPSVD
jgi:hypothetical protein